MTSADGTTGNEDRGRGLRPCPQSADRGTPRGAPQAAAKTQRRRSAASSRWPTAIATRATRKAARAGYEEVLAIDPNLQHDLDPQLGHARKESGDLPAAELAYREALQAEAQRRRRASPARPSPSRCAASRRRRSNSIPAPRKLDPDNGDVQAELTRLREPQVEDQAVLARGPGGARRRAPWMSAAPAAARPSRRTARRLEDRLRRQRPDALFPATARLPTGIQRVQIEVIRNVAGIRGRGPGLLHRLLQPRRPISGSPRIPPSLFRTLCAAGGGGRRSRGDGVAQAPARAAFLRCRALRQAVLCVLAAARCCSISATLVVAAELFPSTCGWPGALLPASSATCTFVHDFILGDGAPSIAWRSCARISSAGRSAPSTTPTTSW